MDAREGGDVVMASVNMWAVLADNDPGDNQYGVVEAGAGDAQPVAVEATAVPDDKGGSFGDKKRKKKKNKKKQAKAAAAELADGEVSGAPPNGKVQSSIGDQKRHDKKTKAAAAVSSVPNGHDGPTTNGRKEPSKKESKAAAAKVGGNNRYQSESEDDDEEVRGGSRVRALFVAAVTTALVAFAVHVSVAAAPAV